jgi:ABC-type nitrate/sulfonate/bicarbonate transport system substrate-binding protein
MQAFIDKNGGDVKSVKLIETPFSEMAVALATGRVAAGILTDLAGLTRVQVRWGL